MTVDLNGQPLSISNGSTAILVGNGAKVTLKDSSWTAPSVSETGEVTMNGQAATAKSSVVAVVDGAEVTIESGNYVSTNSVALWAGVENAEPGTLIINNGYVQAQECSVGALKGGKLAINDGVFKANDNAVISGNGTPGLGNTEMEINGGTFVGKIQSNGYVACGVYHPQDGKLTINGGNFLIENGVGVLVRSGDVTINDANITTIGNVSGKVGDSKILSNCFDVVVDTRSKYPNYENSVTTINGGKFMADENVPSVSGIAAEGDSVVGKIIVNGGVYSSQPTTAFLGENKNVTSNADGTFTVS